MYPFINVQKGAQPNTWEVYKRMPTIKLYTRYKIKKVIEISY